MLLFCKLTRTPLKEPRKDCSHDYGTAKKVRERQANEVALSQLPQPSRREMALVPMKTITSCAAPQNVHIATCADQHRSLRHALPEFCFKGTAGACKYALYRAPWALQLFVRRSILPVVT